MSPPQQDSRLKCPERPSLRKYRNKGHYDFIGLNGSIRIETLDAEILLEERGEVKLSTLAATIKALGGKLEAKAHFSDADFPISLSRSKG